MRRIVYDRLYYTEITPHTPSEAYVASAQALGAMLHPDRSHVFYCAHEHAPVWTRQCFTNPCFRITIDPVPQENQS